MREVCISVSLWGDTTKSCNLPTDEIPEAQTVFGQWLKMRQDMGTAGPLYGTEAGSGWRRAGGLRE